MNNNKDLNHLLNKKRTNPNVTNPPNAKIKEKISSALAGDNKDELRFVAYDVLRQIQAGDNAYDCGLLHIYTRLDHEDEQDFPLMERILKFLNIPYAPNQEKEVYPFMVAHKECMPEIEGWAAKRMVKLNTSREELYNFHNLITDPGVRNELWKYIGSAPSK